MNQISKSINEFSPGDILTRIEPVAKVNNIMSLFPRVEYDSSYIGEKFVFIGIVNGCIFLERENGDSLSIKFCDFENGWAFYIDPSTLFNNKPKSPYESMSDTALIQKLDIAIESEDYEEASRIKHEINKREL